MIWRTDYGDGTFTLIDDDMCTLDQFEDKASETRIYFIQCPSTKLIKIGMAIDVAKRIADIQSMCPTQLRLVTSIQGGREVEVSLHRRFAMARRHGEWFLPINSLLSMIGLDMHGEPKFPMSREERSKARKAVPKKPRVDAQIYVQKATIVGPMQELMQITGLSAAACMRAIDAGELPGYRVGRSYVVSEHEVMLFGQGRWSRRVSRSDSPNTTT